MGRGGRSSQAARAQNFHENDAKCASKYTQKQDRIYMDIITTLLSHEDPIMGVSHLIKSLPSSSVADTCKFRTRLCTTEQDTIHSSVIFEALLFLSAVTIKIKYWIVLVSFTGISLAIV